MKTWTNMLWPEDPYRTGQQLYRRPGPLLAAFAIQVPAGGLAGAVAVAYLPLNRTKAVTPTEQTLAFGYRTAVVTEQAQMPDLAGMTDLDLLQAHRHAAIIAGHALAAGLATLRQAAGTTPLRGIAAVELDWASRTTHTRGSVVVADSADGPLGSPDLAAAGVRAGVRYERPTAGRSPEAAETAALIAERALAIGLVCAKRLGRYQWQGTLHTGQLLAAADWDVAGHQGRTTPPGLPMVARAGGS